MRQPADHRFGKRVSSVAALCAALVFAAGCGGEAPSGAAAPDVVASALCASAKLSAALDGTDAVLTASGCGNTEFRFFHRAPGKTSYTVAREWGTESVARVPTAGTPGRWDFLVHARDVGSTAAYESYATAFQLVGSVCSAATLVAPRGYGDLDLTATPTCAPGVTPEFRFLARPAGTTTYKEIRPFAKEATFRWNAYGLNGRHDLLVYVRAAGNASIYEASAATSALNGVVCTATTLAAKAGAGAKIELEAKPTCDYGVPAELRFLARPQGSTAPYTELRPYAASQTFSWDTTGLASGRYDVAVYARAAGNLSSWEAAGSTAVNVGEACTSATLTAAPVGTPPYGATLTATAACGNATAEFRFLARAPGATTYQELRPWSADPGFGWQGDGAAAGRHDLLVHARRQGNASLYEATAGAAVNVGPTCYAVTLSASRPYPGPLALDALASCVWGAPAQYRFLVKAPGAAAAQELRGWSGDPRAFFEDGGAAPGRWELTVQARVEGNASAYEATTTVVRSYGATCASVALAAASLPSGGLDLSAVAACDAGSVAEYRFLVRRPGATAFEELRGYAPDRTFQWWDAAYAPAGRYELQVQARRAGNLSALEASATVVRNLGPTCSSATLAGVWRYENLELVASAGCDPSVTPLFRFLVRAPGAAAFTELRPWAPEPTLSWESYGQPSGRHELQVQVRSSASAPFAEATATIARNVRYACNAATVAATAPWPGMLRLEATSECNPPSAEYRFLGRAPGAASFEELRPYSWEPFFDWPTASREGRFEVQVQVRFTGNASAYEATATTAVDVGPVCRTATLAVLGGYPYLYAEADAVCDLGHPAEFQFLGRAPGESAFRELRPYSRERTFPWETAKLGGGRYELKVNARRAGSASAWEATATASRDVGPLCTSAALSVVASDDLGAALEATAACGAAPEFRFLARPPGATDFVELRGYSPERGFRFERGANGPGRYELRVEARAAGNASLAEATHTISRLIGPTCGTAGLTIQGEPGAPWLYLLPGATCSDGAGPPEFRLLARAPGAATQVEVRPYGFDTFVPFDASAAPGRWEFTVQARHHWNASDYEAVATASRLVGPTCTAATLTAGEEGDGLRLTADATCAGAAEYRFLSRAPGAAAMVELRGWSPDPSYLASLADLGSGRHEFVVYARVAGNRSTYEAAASAARLVGATCSAATLKLVPVGDAGTTTFDLTAGATCAPGAVPEFRFLVRPPGAAAYQELGAWSGADTIRWETGDLAAGRWDLLVYARAQGNASAYEAAASAGRNVGPTCGSARLALSWEDWGLALDASATCTDGARPEFQFLVKRPGAATYTELTGFQDYWRHDVTGTLDPGAYVFLVNVRAWGNASRAEATASAAYTEPDCGMGFGEPTGLRFVASPGETFAGDYLRARVHVVDAAGCRVYGYAAPITLGLRGGAAGATLEGETTGDASYGDWSFNSVYVTRAGKGYSLVASCPGLASATTAPFAVVAGPPSPERSTLAIEPYNVVANGVDRGSVLVTLRDAFDNPIVGAPVQLASAWNDAVVVAPPAPTDAAGQTSSWITSTRRGGVELSVSTPGLAANALVASGYFVEGPPSAATSTLIAASPAYADDTPVAVTVTVKDALGNPVWNAAVTLSAPADVTLVQPARTDYWGVATGSARSGTVGARTVTASVVGTVIASTVVPFEAMPPLEIGTGALPDAYENETYSAALAARFGTKPYTWSLESGAPPAGLSLSASGTLSGTVPAGAAGSTFTVRVTDAAGASATRPVQVTVYRRPSLEYPAMVAYPYLPFSGSPTVSGGKPPYTFALTSKPYALEMSPSTGALSGSFRHYQMGGQRFVAEVRDANGMTGAFEGQIDVTPAPAMPGGGTSVARWGKVTDALTVIAVDEANQPVAGAGVRIRRNGYEYADTRTDASGRAYVTGLYGATGDTYDVTVSGPGHATTSILEFNSRVITVPLVARPVLQARSQHQAALASSGKVLVFGGDLVRPAHRVRRFGKELDPAYTSDLLSIDPATGAVTELVAPQLSTSPPPTAGGVMMTLGARTFVYGGWITPPATPTARRLHAGTWEWSSGSWIARALGPEARAGAGVATLAGHAYLFGGVLAGDVYTNEVWRFDGAAWTKLATTGGPPAARAHAAVGIDAARSKLVVLGGRNAAGNLTDLWELDLGTLGWSQRLAGGLTDRAGASMACAPGGGTCFVYGGENAAAGSWLGDQMMLRWDGTTLAALTQPQMFRPYARVHASFLATGGSRYLLVGGAQTSSPYSVAHGDVWAYDSASNVWTELVRGPSSLPYTPPVQLEVRISPADSRSIRIDVTSQHGGVESRVVRAYETPQLFDVPPDANVRALATSLDYGAVATASVEARSPATGRATVDVTIPATASTAAMSLSVLAPPEWGTSYTDLGGNAFTFFSQPGNAVWSEYPVFSVPGGVIGAPRVASDTLGVRYAVDPSGGRQTDLVTSARSSLPKTCELSHAAALGTNQDGSRQLVHRSVGAGMAGVSECDLATPPPVYTLALQPPVGANLAVIRFAPEGLPVERIVYRPVDASAYPVRVDLLPLTSSLVPGRSMALRQYVDWTVDTIRIPQLPGANGISEAPFKYLRWESKQESGARTFERQ